MTPQRTIAKIDRYEPVVQLDRTLPSEGKDRWFESNRVRHIKNTFMLFARSIEKCVFVTCFILSIY